MVRFPLQNQLRTQLKRTFNLNSFLCLTLILSSLIFTVGGCSTSTKKTTSNDDKIESTYNQVFKDKIQNYIKFSKLLMENSNKGVTPEFLLKDAHTLMTLGTPIVQEFIEYHPECKKYLETVLSFSDMMTKISLEEIEDQFHAGEALPNADEICVTAKELIVHPATIIILANDLSQGKPNLTEKMVKEKIAFEIEEVLAHIDNL